MRILIGSLLFICLCGLPFLYISKKSELPPQHLTNLSGIKTSEFTVKKNLENDVDTFFQNSFARGEYAGAAVTIVYKDSVIYSGYFGSSSSVTNKKINGETVFRIGSLSKGFCGILGGMIVEQGEISWETYLTDCIPNFQLSKKEYADKITFSHLLSHSAGFPYHSFTNLIEDGLSLNKIIAEFKNIQNIERPGEIYSYQNAAFSLTGLMLEQSTHFTYDEMIKKRIFEPLNMRNASSSYEGFINQSNVAHPQRQNNGIWYDIPYNKKYYNAVPAGGINASIDDMSQWLKLLLGNFPNLITQNALDEIFTPIIDTKVGYKYYKNWPKYTHSYYGRGWRILTFEDENYKTDTLIHHAGSVNGFHGEIAIHRKDNIGICVLFNSSSNISQECIPFLLQKSRENILLPDCQ